MSKSSYPSSNNLIWNMDQALQGDQESAYEAGILLDVIDKKELALRYFEMADKFPEALYERYVRNHDEDLLLSAAKGGSWRACNDLGVRSAKREIFPDAKEWFQNVEPDGVLYYNLAQLLRKDGYERDAKKYYKLSWENGFTPAANNLGVIAFNKDKKEKAAKLLSTAAHHTDTITRENYARVLEDQGKYILAAGQWRVLGNIERQIAALQRIEAPPAKRSRIELKFDERFFSVSEAESLAFYREI